MHTDNKQNIVLFANLVPPQKGCIWQANTFASRFLSFLPWTVFGSAILTTPTIWFPWETRQCSECSRLFLATCTSTGVRYFALSSFPPQRTHRSWITSAFVSLCCALFVPLPPYDLSNVVRKKKKARPSRKHAIHSAWAYLPILFPWSSELVPGWVS